MLAILAVTGRGVITWVVYSACSVVVFGGMAVAIAGKRAEKAARRVKSGR